MTMKVFGKINWRCSPPPFQPNTYFQMTQLTKDEIQRRDRILETHHWATPKFNKNLLPFSFTPQEFIYFISNHIEIIHLHTGIESIIEGTALQIKNPDYFCSNLTCEFLIDPSKMNVKKGRRNAIISIIKSACVDFIVDNIGYHKPALSQNCQENKEKQAKETNWFSTQKPNRIFDDLQLIENFLELEYIFNENSEITHFKVTIGENVHIIFGFIINGQRPQRTEEFSRVDSLRVFLRNKCFAYCNFQQISDLTSRQTVSLNSDPTKILPFAKVLRDTQGFTFQNEEMISKIARQTLLKMYSHKSHNEKESALMDHRALTKDFMSFQRRHYPEHPEGHIYSFMNYLSFFSDLPEPDFKTFSSTAAQAASTLNPLAELISNQSALEIQNILTWLQGVLFCESFTNTNRIIPFPHGQQLAIKTESGTYFVKVKKGPIALTAAMIHSWKSMDTASNNNNNRLQKVLQTCKCSIVTTFSHQALVGLCQRLITADNPLAKTMEAASVNELVSLFGSMRSVFTETVLKEKELEAMLRVARHDNDGDTEILQQLEQHEKLSDIEIMQIAKYVQDSTNQVNASLHRCITLVLYFVMERFIKLPTTANLHSIQKLFLTLETKMPLSIEDREQIFDRLVELYRVHNGDVRESQFVTVASALLCTVMGWKQKPKLFENLCKSLMMMISEALPDLLKSLDRVDTERVVYQAIFALIRTLPAEKAKIDIPKYLEFLLNNLEKINSNSVLQIDYRSRRAEILAALSKLTPENGVLEKLNKLLVREIMIILQSTQMCNLHASLKPFVAILVSQTAVNGIKTKIEENLKSNADLIGLMRYVAILCIRIDNSITEKMLCTLHQIRPGSAKYNSLLIIQSITNDKKQLPEQLGKAISIFQTWVASYVEDGLSIKPLVVDQIKALSQLLFSVLTHNSADEKLIVELIDSFTATLKGAQKAIQKNAEIFSEFTKKDSQNSLQPMFAMCVNNPISKPRCLTLILSADASGLISDMELLRRDLCKIDNKLSAETNLDILCNTIHNSRFDKSWESTFETESAIPLFKRLDSENHQHLIEKFFNFLEEKKLFESFSSKGKLEICGILLRSKKLWLFFQAWNTLFETSNLTPEQAYTFSEAVFDRMKRENNVLNGMRFVETLRQLYLKSFDLRIYRNVIAGALEFSPNAKSLHIFVNDLVGAYGNVEAFTTANSSNEQLIVSIIHSLIKYTIQLQKENASSASDSVDRVERFIPFTQAFTAAHSASLLPLINSKLFSLLSNSRNPKYLLKAAKIFQQGAIKNAGQLALDLIQSTYELATESISKDLEKCVVHSIKILQARRALTTDDSLDILQFITENHSIKKRKLILLGLKIAKSICLHSESLPHFEKNEKDNRLVLKQSQSTLSKRIEKTLIVLTQPLPRFGCYRKLLDTDLWAAKLFSGPLWAIHVTKLLNNFSEIVSKHEYSESIARTIFKQFQILLPLYIKYEYLKGQKNILWLGAYTIKHKKSPGMRNEFENIIKLATKFGVFDQDKVFRATVDNIRVGTTPCDHSDTILETFQIFSNMLTYLEMETKNARGLETSLMHCSQTIIYGLMLGSNKHYLKYNELLDGLFKRASVNFEIFKGLYKTLIMQCLLSLQIRLYTKKKKNERDNWISKIETILKDFVHDELYDHVLREFTPTILDYQNNLNVEESHFYVSEKAEMAVIAFASADLLHLFFKHAPLNNNSMKFISELTVTIVKHLRQILTNNAFDLYMRNAQERSNVWEARLLHREICE